MNRTAPVALVLVSLLAFITPAASLVQAEASALTPPAFRVGDVASYSLNGAWLNLTVEAPLKVYDKSSREVDVFAIRRGEGENARYDYISLSSMTIESDFGCAVRINGKCYMDKFVWWDQGVPGALGATLLQGRAFLIGDSWAIEGECTPCRKPIEVTIEAAHSTSPPGTAYVARIRGDYGGSFDAWRVSGLVHMGTSHAFPLRLDLDDGRVFTLTAYTPGTTPIVPPSPPEPATYVPSLPLVPFENRRPYEGTPPEGWPSWAEARAATGPDPIDTNPNASFAWVIYSLEREYLGIDSTRIVNLTKHVDITVQFDIADGQDRIFEYLYEEPRPADVELGKGVWTSSTRQGNPSSLTNCPDEGLPIWDTIRLGWSFGFLRSHHGFMLAGFDGPLCTSRVLQVHGAPTGLVFPPHEFVQYHFATGYLRDAWYLR